MLALDQAFIVASAPMIGSFFETLYRRSPLQPADLIRRSRCQACSSPVSAIGLIPIFGYLYNRGKCSTCSAVLSPYYLATEVLFLVVAVWAALFAKAGQMYPSIGLGWLLVMLARIDLERFILPYVLNLSVLVLGICLLPFVPLETQVDRTAGALAGFTLFVAIDWIYARVRGQTGLGRGDAKLIGAGGIWTGVSGLPAVLLVSSLTAIALLLVQQARANSALKSQDRVAFGPAIALATWIVWMHGSLFY